MPRDGYDLVLLDAVRLQRTHAHQCAANPLLVAVVRRAGLRSRRTFRRVVHYAPRVPTSPQLCSGRRPAIVRRETAHAGRAGAGGARETAPPSRATPVE